MPASAVRYFSRCSTEPGYTRLNTFDIVLVGKMDWFGRSLQSLIANLQVLDSAGIRFVAPSQNIDTNNKSSRGKCLMQIVGAFAEFHRHRVRTGMREYQRAYTHGEIGKVRHIQSGRDLPVGRQAFVRNVRRSRLAH